MHILPRDRACKEVFLTIQTKSLGYRVGKTNTTQPLITRRNVGTFARKNSYKIME